MTYRLRFLPSAERELADLPRTARDRIQKRVESLRDNPRPPGCKKLAGVDDLWRIRVGDYRVIYTVQDEVLLVLVVRVGHRRDVYR